MPYVQARAEAKAPGASGVYALCIGKGGSESPRRSRLLDVYALCTSKSESAIPRLLQSALFALCICKDGSESPRRSRLLDLVHAHLLVNESSFCSSGCIVLAQMSRRRLSLPPLLTHVALRGVAGGGFARLLLPVHVAFCSFAGGVFVQLSLTTCSN